MAERLKFSITAILFQLVLYNWSHKAFLCDAFNIDSKSWEHKGHHIAYEELSNNASVLPSVSVTQNVRETASPPPPPLQQNDDDKVSILLLNGFGVGSFHQHRLMPKLTSSSRKTRVYAIDYLGQGRSWPNNCDDGNSPTENGLIYSIDTWADQTIRFIEERILHRAHDDDDNGTGTGTTVKKVHLVGNSVGGHLAAVLASRRPDLIASICLLNATPVWGLNLPGWSGHLPPPAIPRAIGRYLFDRIRDLGTIEKYLENAYANRGAFDDDLIAKIRNCTVGKGGHAAFASILWSPPATLPSDASNFYSSLSRLECDVLLIFGKNDPWCKPSFGRRMFSELHSRNSGIQNKDVVQRYIELDNVGHCPNHEAPTVVGQVISRWVDNELHLIDGEVQLVPEPWGDISAREIKEDGVQLSRMDKFFTSLVS